MACPNPQIQTVQVPEFEPNPASMLVLPEPVMRWDEKRSSESVGNWPQVTQLLDTKAWPLYSQSAQLFNFTARSVCCFNSLSVFSGSDSPSSFLPGCSPHSISVLSLWEVFNMSPSLTQWIPERNKPQPYHGVTQSKKKKNSETITSLFCT